VDAARASRCVGRLNGEEKHLVAAAHAMDREAFWELGSDDGIDDDPRQGERVLRRR
jgi:hypothetical protein